MIIVRTFPMYVCVNYYNILCDCNEMINVMTVPQYNMCVCVNYDNI